MLSHAVMNAALSMTDLVIILAVNKQPLSHYLDSDISPAAVAHAYPTYLLL